MMRLGGDLGIFLWPENHLGQALAIAQVDKNNATVIAPNMDPTGEHRGLADVALAEFVAMVGSVHDAESALSV